MPYTRSCLRAGGAQDVLAARGEILRAVGDAAIDRARLVRAAVALVVHAPGVEAARGEPLHHGGVRPARHVQVEGRLRSHGRPVHEQNGAGVLRGRGRRLAPEEQPYALLARPMLGALHPASPGQNPCILCKNPAVLGGGTGSMSIDIGTHDTFPKLLRHHALTRGARPAIREKDLGIWQTWTWKQFADEARALACGLAAQGFKRGDHLAIVGDNRPRLYAAMCAAQCLGRHPGAAVPGRGRRRDGVPDPERRDRVRGGGGPGAGGQAARDPAAVPHAPAHLLRRGARHAPLQAAAARELRQPDRGGACGVRARSGLSRGRDREGTGQRHRGHVLHLRHHGPTEGRGAHAPRAHRPRARRGRDGRHHRPRRGARLPAARLGRTEHLFLRAALRHRLLHLLPGIGGDRDDRHARDRADAIISRRPGCWRRC